MKAWLMKINLWKKCAKRKHKMKQSVKQCKEEKINMANEFKFRRGHAIKIHLEGFRASEYDKVRCTCIYFCSPHSSSYLWFLWTYIN